MAGLLDGARRRGEFGRFWCRKPGRKRLVERLRSEGKPVRPLRGAAERCSEFATANCGASGDARRSGASGRGRRVGAHRGVVVAGVAA